MNPDKLFDYLDGTLPPHEREQLEEQLARDPRLQRELAMARRIHKGMRGDSPEVLAPPDPREIERGRKIGGRVAAAFGALVLLNVFIGIFFIIRGHEAKPGSDEARRQVTNLVEHAAARALPTPTLSEEIRLRATPEERDKVAGRILIIAREAGGEAVKAPPDAEGLTVLATIPASRVPEFRRGVAPLGDIDFSSSAPTPSDSRGVFGEKANVYIRITDSTAPPSP